MDINLRRPVRQVSEGKWPSGREKAIGVLRFSPSDLEALGLEFTSGADDLDTFKQAGLQLYSGRLLLLMRYANDSAPGTTVLADSVDDAAAAREELLLSLALPADSYSWVSPPMG